MAAALVASAHPLLLAKRLSFHPQDHRISLYVAASHFQRRLRTKVLKAASSSQGVVALTREDDGVSDATLVDSQISLYDSDEVFGGAFEVDEDEDDFGRLYAVPKKRTSKSKKNIRKNFWFRKGNVAAKKAISLAKSILSGKSKSFMYDVEKPED